MLTPPPAPVPPSPLTPTELRVLRPLRARYAQERDFFSPQEVGRLRFLRWLYRRGRLTL